MWIYSVNWFPSCKLKKYFAKQQQGGPLWDELKILLNRDQGNGGYREQSSKEIVVQNNKEMVSIDGNRVFHVPLTKML